MSTLEGKILRLACNQSASTPILDTLTGEPLVIWRGAGARLQCVLFIDEPTEDTIVTDISNVLQVELIVRSRNALGNVLLDKVLTAADVGACTWDNWVNLSDQHFEFSLVDSDTNQAVPASGELHIWFSIEVTTALSAYIVAQGYGRIVEVGIVDVADPVDPALTAVVTDETVVVDGDPVVFSGTTGARIRKATGVEVLAYTDDGVPFRPWFDAAGTGLWARKPEPKIYAATLTQSSTSAPVATVGENSLGGTLVWAYSSSGVYTATLASVFVADKTHMFITPPSSATRLIIPIRTSTSVITLSTYSSGSPANGILTETAVRFLVYP